jgi:hypothetical protein
MELRYEPIGLISASIPLPRKFPLPMGTMRYLDEGDGKPFVMVHGNPSWSFEFRHLIKAFASTHRCIAPDHIGFGLSDKPADWGYLPQQQAENLEALLERARPARNHVHFQRLGRSASAFLRDQPSRTGEKYHCHQQLVLVGAAGLVLSGL